MTSITSPKKLGRLEGLLDYLRETNRLWSNGMLSVDDLSLRLSVLDRIQVDWEKAEAEEAMDRGSEADQTADYFGGEVES